MAYISFTSTGSSLIGTLFSVGTVTSGTIVVGQTLTGGSVPPGTVIVSPNGQNWNINISAFTVVENIDGALYVGQELGIPNPGWPWEDYTWIQQGFLIPPDLTKLHNQKDWPLPIPDYRE